MREFYERFYSVVGTSPAHAHFCERAFGRNLGQHGFADMDQLEALINVTGLGPAQRALDLGCGNGLVAEYLSDRCGARILGVDHIPEAIRQAQERTAPKADRLAFLVGDINCLDFAAGVLDMVLMGLHRRYLYHVECTGRPRVERKEGETGHAET